MKAGRRGNGGGAARLAYHGGVGGHLGRRHGLVAVRVGAAGLAEAIALRTVAVPALGQKAVRNLEQEGAGLAADRMVVALVLRRSSVPGLGQLV